MTLSIVKEAAALKRLSIGELRSRYAEVFGDETRANNKPWLVKRIAWRMQALTEGGLSERARRRAAELANDADLRLAPPRPSKAGPITTGRTTTQNVEFRTDHRLPMPGTIITRPYKGETLRIQVLANGIEYDGSVYKSLSGVAKAITGSHCNGFQFFKIGEQGGHQ